MASVDERVPSPTPNTGNPPDDKGVARKGEAGRRAGREPVPKLRSRKDGAAIALDDLDKRLLNLMQGQFPIAARHGFSASTFAATSIEL